MTAIFSDLDRLEHSNQPPIILTLNLMIMSIVGRLYGFKVIAHGRNSQKQDMYHMHHMFSTYFETHAS